MKTQKILVSVAAAWYLAAGWPATAADSIFVPLFTYRTGPAKR
jgi:hypothetical protein